MGQPVSCDSTHHLPTPSDTHCTLCNIARTSPEMHDVCVGTAAEPAADGPNLWDAIAADLRAGRSLRAIAAERHVGKDFVQRIRHTLNLPAPEPSPAKLARDARITELWNDGVITAVIGAEFKFSASRVSKIAKALGLPPRPSPLGKSHKRKIDREGAAALTTLAAIRNELGITRCRPEPASDRRIHQSYAERDARITALWIAGTPIRDIGAEFEISDSRVSQIAQRLGLASRTSVLGRGRNSADIRQKAEALLRAGQSNSAVARECGIDKDTAANIRRGLGLAKYRRPVAAVKKKRRGKVKAVAPAPVPVRVVLPPAPVEVRGTPGVWGIPIGRTLEQIEAIAAAMAYPFGGLHDLPWLNKHRVARGFAPLCVNFPKRDVPLPSRLRSRVI